MCTTQRKASAARPGLFRFRKGQKSFYLLIAEYKYSPINEAAKGVRWLSSAVKKKGAKLPSFSLLLNEERIYSVGSTTETFN